MNCSRQIKTFYALTGAALVVLISACGDGQLRVKESAQRPDAAETAKTTRTETTADAKSAGQNESAEVRALESVTATSSEPATKSAADSARTQTFQAQNGSPALMTTGSVFHYQDDDFYRPVQPDRENYQQIDTNPIKRVIEQPVSTFSVDVDTGAYSNMRRFLENGQLPQADAVRAEELINYFDYAYQTPNSDETPFSINTLLMPTPWNENTNLLRIGLRGYDVDPAELPHSNLVFLIDVSGSMNQDDKLPLLKRSMQLLSNKMRADDRIAVVVYAGDSGVALESTSGDEKRKINRSIKMLRAGGSTHGSAGINLAYEIAADNFIEGGINRVILATDGDFNVGAVDVTDLIKMIEKRRDSGISLTTLGFGSGNLNDHLMEQLADSGNGNYAYIDTLSEANKVLVKEMSSTLHTIASDVKIQIEFNPRLVAEYRLIGYENRGLNREDFNNDRIDAGEIGAGHTVTALYEIALAGSGGERIEPLRYSDNERANADQTEKAAVALIDDEVAHVRLRYKKPGQSQSKRVEQSIGMQDRVDRLEQADDDARFSAAVAAFAQKLRGGEYLGDFDFESIRILAKDSRGEDEFGYRAEFLTLVALADSLQPLNVSINEKRKQ